MRKKIEEELAKLAFGDLDADTARRLELHTQSDPEATRTYETYRRMKDELRSLCDDVPADQLSKDRLREAILTRGLKEHRPVSRLSWMWMPAAAAVLAFSFVALKGRIPMGEVGAPMVLDYTNGVVPEIPGVGVERPISNDTVAQDVAPSRIVLDKPATTVAMSNERPRRTQRENFETTPSRSVAEEPLLGGHLDLTSEPMLSRDALASTPIFDAEPPAAAEAKIEALRPAPRNDDSEMKIVLIQTETDANTGTLRATEVESTANVVVGG